MYPNLFSELMIQGWSEEDLAKLAGQNILRVFSSVEKVYYYIIPIFIANKILANNPYFFKSMLNQFKIKSHSMMSYHKEI
jgi:hypothetical protein